MRVCSKCNDTYPDDANFCLRDGTPLSLSSIVGKQCPKCQRTYPLEAGFCMIEGAPLLELHGVGYGDDLTVDSTPARKKAQRSRIKKVTAHPRSKKRTNKGPDQQAIFTKGLTIWFQQMKFGVGLSPQKVDTEKDLQLAEKLAGVATTLVDFGSSMWITGGQGSEELFQALIPFMPLCDLLGSNLKLATATLVPVIYADKLLANEIEQRFDQFIEMAGPLTEFGPRLNFQSQGAANIFPLVVYFDHQTFERHLPDILPDAWQKRIMRRIYLQASLVSVPERKVVVGERTGFFALGEKIADALGTKSTLFESSDIDAVLLLGNEKDGPH